MELTLKEVLKAVDGKVFTNCDLEQKIVGIEFDARKINKGDLFVPMKGNTDGQTFINQAKNNGAICALYEDDKYLVEDIICIKVDDTLDAFQKLAKFYLQKVNPKVLAITGSNGKTTTKDMTYAVAMSSYKTYKTEGNYNNEIGMPYTILNMPSDTEVLVLEMGMDNFGQIHELSKIATPDAAAITLIGESHIEMLGSREGIAKAKLEIVDGLKTNGTLIVPKNEPLLQNLDLKQSVMTFGIENDADYSAKIVNVYKDKTEFLVNITNEEIWSIPVIGDYNVSNALIAVAFGRVLNIPVEKIRNALANFELTKNRTEWKVRNNGAEILSDVYNANPTAMKKVLDNFAKVDTNKTKIAVLGDMLELGPDTYKMHQSISKHLNKNEIKYVVLYGEIMNSLYEELKNTYDENHLLYYKVSQRNEFIHDLDELLASDTMTIFKASNGMKLAEVVESLVK